MKKKRIIIIAIIAVVVIAGAALAVFFLLPERESLPVEEVEEDVPKISIWHQFSTNEPAEEYLTEIANDIHKNYDGYLLEVECYNGVEMRNKLLAAKNSGTLPDVVFVEPEWLPELVRLDILTPLDENEEYYSSISRLLVENTVDSGRRGEHIYGFPFSVSTQMLIYNPQLFADADIQPPATISEMKAAAEDVHELGSDTFGFGVHKADAENLAPLLWGGGGEFTNTKQTQASQYINSSKNISTIEMLVELIGAGVIYDADGGDASLAEQFGTGRLGMVIADTDFLQELITEYPDIEYENIPLPANSGKPKVVLNSMLLAIPAKEDISIGWELAKTLTSDTVQTKFASFNIMPSNKIALESTAATKAPYNPFVPYISTARPLPNVTEWVDMNNEFSMAMSQIVGGYKTVQQAMDDLAKTWDALLP